MHYILNTLEDTDTLARILSQIMPADFIVTLNGNLGAGKTTLVRGILVLYRALPEHHR